MAVRIALVSDIHSNLTAFRAVLRHAEGAGGVDAVWCAGDIVGYGPHPNECVALLRELEHRAVAGNHDLAAVGRMDTDDFNPVAATAASWTSDVLDDEARAYLGDLPLVDGGDDFTLVHGSLRDPEWEYLLTGMQARAHFELQGTRHSMVGHSHLPFVCRAEDDALPRIEPASDGDVVELGDGLSVVNPGGAGQPRDGDPRAPYALYDREAATVTFHRVEYDIDATQRAMREAGLPRWLIERLSQGV